MDAIPRLAPNDLARLVKDIADGEVFFTADGHEIGEAFGLILSVVVREWSEEYIESLGGAWAPWSTAFPTTANGIPMFTSMHAIHRDDARLIVSALRHREAKDAQSEQPRPEGQGSSHHDAGGETGAVRVDAS